MADEILGISAHADFSDMYRELSSLIEKFRESASNVSKLKQELSDLASSGASATVLVSKTRELADAQRKASQDALTALDANSKYWTALNAAEKDVSGAKKAHEELNAAYKQLREEAEETNKVLDQYSDTIEDVSENTKEASKDIKDGADEMGRSLENIKNKIVGLLAVWSAKEFGRKVMETRGQFQQLEVAFTTMLGSAEKANQLMTQLTKTAAITPFDLQGVTQGAKQLLAYGIAADEINDTLIHLGDIAAGLSLPLNDLVYLYGTTMTQGRMFTQDLRQFMGRGIPIAEELAKQFGVTKDKVGELVSAGKVGAEEFKAAIMAMSSEGGKFAGLMEEQSKTITGQISNIEDAIDGMFNDLGKQSEGIINGALGVTSYLVENYEKVGKVLMELLVVYGAYKTALITISAIESFATKQKKLQAGATAAATAAKGAETAATVTLSGAELVHYGRLMLVQKAQALLNATMLTNPYVLAAAAIGGLIVAVYELATAETAAEAGVRKANEQLKEQDELLSKRKANIEELINVIRDENQTEYAKIDAYNKLKAVAPEITDMYSRQALQIMELDKVQKLLNKDTEGAKFEQAKKNVEEYTRMVAGLEKTIESYLNDPLQQATDKNGVRYSKMLQQLDEAKSALEKYKEILNEIQETQKQVEEESKKNLEDMEFDELLKHLDEAYKTADELSKKDATPEVQPTTAEELEKALDDALQKIAELDAAYADPKATYQSINDAEKAAKDAIDKIMYLDSSEASPDVDTEKIDNAKKKVQEAIEKMDGLSKMTANPNVVVTGIQSAIDKVRELWRWLQRVSGKKDSEIVEPESSSNKTSKGTQQENINQTVALLKKQANKANTREKIENLLKSVNEKLKSAEIGSQKEKDLLALKKQLEAKTDKGQNAGAKAEKEEKKRDAREIQEERKFQAELSKARTEAMQAEDAAYLASIKDQGDREREERRLQHEQTLRELEKEQDEIYQKLYQYRKEKWENEHKDSPYELTEEGRLGWGRDKDGNYVMAGTFTEDEQRLFDAYDAAVKAKKLKAEYDYSNELEEIQKREIRDSWEYLTKYGSVLQKKAAIEASYQEQIEEATSESKRKLLRKQMEEDLSALSLEEISQGIDWRSLLGGVENLSRGMMEPLLDKLEAYTKTKAFQEEPIERQQEVVSLIGELKQYVGKQSNETGVLAVLLTDFENAVSRYNEIVEQEKVAVAELNDLKTRSAAGDTSVTQEMIDAASKKVNEHGEAVAEAKEDVVRYGNAVNSNTTKISQSVGVLTQKLNELPFDLFENSLKQASTEIDNYVNKLTKLREESLANDIKKNPEAQERIQELKNLLSTGAITESEYNSEIKLLIDQFGSENTKLISGLESTISKMSDGMGGVLGSILGEELAPLVSGILALPKIILTLADTIGSTITGILDSFSELISFSWLDKLVTSIIDAITNLIDTILDLPENLAHVLEHIGESAVNLVGTVVGRLGNILTLGALDSDWLGFGGADYSEYDALVEKYEKLISLWGELIDKKMEYINTSWGAEVIAAGDDAVDVINAQADAYRELGKARLNAGASKGSSSIGRRITKRMNKEDWQGIANSLGWTVDQTKDFIGTTRMTGIFDLTGEQLQKIKEGNMTWWAQLDDDVKSYLESIIANGEKLEEVLEKEKERLTTTTADNVFEGFMDNLYNMADGADDVFDNIADNWQKMVNKMVINNLIANKFQEKLEKWYEELATLNEEKSKEGSQMTDEAYKQRLDELKKRYEDYAKEAQEDIESFRSAGIISATGSNNPDQQATYNSLEKWTYEQADELINRATAMQIIQEHIYEQQQAVMESNMSMAQSMAGIKESVSLISEGITMTIELHEAANSKLDRIVANTAPITEIRDLVKKIYNER